MSLISILAEHGDRVAVATDAVELSYRELLARVADRQRVLSAAGIATGDVVALEIADEVDHLIDTLALLEMGTRHIMVPSHEPATARQELVERIEANFVVSASGIARRAERVAVASDQGGMIYLKTSGTTGGVNIIPFSVDQLAHQARRHPEYADERQLCLATMEYNIGRRHRLYCAIMGGASVFRPRDDFDVAAFCRAHGVNSLEISRMHASILAAGGELGRFDGVKLRIAGSPVPIDVRRAIEQRVTPMLYVRYGSTETGSISVAGPGEHNDAESVGRPLAGLELQIVDTNDRALPAGGIGRIRVRGAGLATGYLDQGEQTASRFRDGWFIPGDVGSLTDDGSLIVHGREDDMMILNGINIFPGEIERVLERHPAVRIAAALPLKSPVHGQIPVAAVELVDGAEVKPAELQRFAREHLALRAPRRVLILKELPRNSQGKILRREIARAFEQGKQDR
jgi:acyl-coenzyme A synthetase/AMP-(fatty) acid ligase